MDEKKTVVAEEDEVPKEVKKSDAQILKHVLGKAEEAKVVKRIGLPWERPREGGMFDRFWDTAIGVMNNATETFAEMKLTGGIGTPMKFLLVGAILGSLIAAVYGLVGNAINVISTAEVVNELAEEATEEDGEVTPAAVGTVVTAAMVIYMVISFVATFFGGIIGGFIHAFLQAGGLQLALPIAGVKQPSFEKNFRLAAYTNGSIFLCNIVPGLGAGFMLFLWFNGMIKGIASVYDVPTKTAVIAVLLLFLPLVLPIVAVVGFVALVMLGYMQFG